MLHESWTNSASTVARALVRYPKLSLSLLYNYSIYSADIATNFKWISDSYCSWELSKFRRNYLKKKCFKYRFEFLEFIPFVTTYFRPFENYALEMGPGYNWTRKYIPEPDFSHTQGTRTRHFKFRVVNDRSSNFENRPFPKLRSPKVSVQPILRPKLSLCTQLP